MGQDHIVKGIFWLVPVIFGAGGVYANISSAQEKVATVEKRLENVESKFEIHDKMPAHPVTAKEIKTIKRQQREILVEQRAMRGDQRRAGENLSAICQATGANCR